MLLQQQIHNLKRSYRDILIDVKRRDAFDNIKKAWSSETGAMTYVQLPTILDIMWLTAIVDNRKLIEELYKQIGRANSQIDKILVHLESF